MRFLACSRQSKHWRKTRIPTDAESSMARKASGVSALATTESSIPWTRVCCVSKSSGSDIANRFIARR